MADRIERIAEQTVDRVELEEFISKSIKNILGASTKQLAEAVGEITSNIELYNKQISRQYGSQEKYLTELEKNREVELRQISALNKAYEKLKRNTKITSDIASKMGTAGNLETGQADKFASIIEAVAKANKQSIQEFIKNNVNINNNTKQAFDKIFENAKDQTQALKEFMNIGDRKLQGPYGTFAKTFREDLKSATASIVESVYEHSNQAQEKIYEKILELDESVKNSKDIEPVLESIEQTMKDLSNKFGLNNSKNTIGEYYARYGSQFIEKYQEAFQKGLEKNFTMDRLRGSVYDKGGEMLSSTFGSLSDLMAGNPFSGKIWNYHDNSVELFRQTSQTYDTFGKTLDQAVVSMRELNVSSEEVIRSFQALFENYKGFGFLSTGNQQELQRLSNVLERVGVSTSQSAQTFDALSRVLQRTDIKGATNDVAQFSRALGVPVQKAFSDLNSNLDYFGRHGKNSLKIFKELEVLANKTGSEISSLVQITQGFDTFEDAGQKVGELNAILRGPFLNTMDFINERDPAKQLQMIANAIKNAGSSLDDYDVSNAIASSLGTTVSELKRLSGQDISKVQDLTEQFNSQAQSLQDLEEVAGKANVKTTDYTKRISEAISMTGHFGGILNGTISVFSALAPVITTAAAAMQLYAARAVLAGNASAFAGKGAGFLLGRLGLLAGVGVGGYLAYDAYTNNKGTTEGVLEGIAGGALAGASIGAFFSPLGAGIGAGIGGIVGGITGYADGTDNAPGGLSIVGERGPELISLPSNSSVINNRNFEKFVSSNNSTFSAKTTNNIGNKQMDLNLTAILKLDEDVLATLIRKVSLDVVDESLNVVVS